MSPASLWNTKKDDCKTINEMNILLYEMKNKRYLVQQNAEQIFNPPIPHVLFSNISFQE